jgi:sugar transport system ATP-binding protein
VAKAPSAGIPAAKVTQAFKRYPGVLALDDVSIEIAPGEVRALLGKNGAGKSTLIRLLTGAELPDEGQVEIGGRQLKASAEHRTRAASFLGVRAVYQELSLVPGMDVAENLFMGAWPGGLIGLDHRLMLREAEAALERLGIGIDPRQRVGALSPAQRQLVEIARAMMGEPRLVILDEPTSSLAAHEVELVFKAVRHVVSNGVAVLYVSHRMKEIRAIAHSATVMRDGRMIGTVPMADVETDEIVRMMLGRAAEERAVIEARPIGEPVLTVSDFALAPKLDGLDFDLRRGEVLGIAGLLGSGRTELLRAIAGIDSADGGTVALNGQSLEKIGYGARIARGIAITPENRKDDGIFPALGVDENIVLADSTQVSSSGIISWRKVKDAAQAIVNRMSVKTSDLKVPIVTLSGGNQQKVVIGRWIYAGASVLLLDEPTRGVDVEAKAQIYALVRSIAAEGKSVIFVSSEIEELPLVCDRVLVLRDGRFAAEFAAPNIDTDRLMAASLG